jgi:hypothetical protein
MFVFEEDGDPSKSLKIIGKEDDKKRSININVLVQIYIRSVILIILID